MRLIDADALKETICTNVYPITDNFNSQDYGMFWTGGIEKAIDDAPTVDTERHGHWIITNKPNIYGGTIIKCSECGYEGVIAHIEDHHYCWVCGAKMDAIGEK